MPTEFVFPNGAKMGMDRAQIRILHEGKPRRDSGDVLVYQTELMEAEGLGWETGARDARITYTFDAQGRLCLIKAQFTQTPYDPNYYIGDFESVSYNCIYAYYGAPEEEEPMIWSQEHTFDPRDGSTRITAVQRGALEYRHTWLVGDVAIAHVLKGEGGTVQHILSAGAGE
jgi:hypothetical protein